MTRLKRIKRFVAGLLLLAVCSLVVEQLVCLAWVPGYYWKLLASPRFLERVFCCVFLSALAV